MSGILDPKSRILDVIVTSEGRRQITQGKMRIVGASFTDSSTFYSPDAVSGSADATQRIYLEAAEFPHDQIVFESDDSGRLVPFRSMAGAQIRAGQLSRFELVESGSTMREVSHVLSGAELDDSISAALGASISSFRNQMLIGTFDRTFDDEGFSIGPSSIEFTISDDRPITRADAHHADVDHMQSLFQDDKLSGLPNFRYLPPINSPTRHVADRTDVRQLSDFFLGNYKPLGATRILSYKTVAAELSRISRVGCRRTLSFDPTTHTNEIVGQFFERSHGTLRKLDVIDFGLHATGNRAAPTAHVFFVGKVCVDSVGTDTFVHLFTLVFE